MKKIFYTIFCEFFRSSERIGNSDRDFYAFKVMGIFAVLIWLNLLTVIAYFKRFILYAQDYFVSKTSVIIVGIVAGSILYFVFVKDKKYELIYYNFSDKTNEQRTNTGWSNA
jgi:hypothetical protein